MVDCKGFYGVTVATKYEHAAMLALALQLQNNKQKAGLPPNLL